MYKDAYDLELSCASDTAAQRFADGIRSMLRLDTSGIVEFSAAIAEDPEFALAHMALARQAFIRGERSLTALHRKQALQFAEPASQRERSAVAAEDLALRNDPGAVSAAEAHVAEWPHDVFVLSNLLSPFGLLAFSGTDGWQQRNHVLLDATRAHYPADDWWHLTTSGFMKAENGDLEDARRDCERAWTLDENGNCAHSLAHLHFEACAIDEGRSFLTGWAARYGAQSDMRHHLLWHLAFLDLEDGSDAATLLKFFDAELDGDHIGPLPLETLADNASLLWRCRLAGGDIPAPTQNASLAFAEAAFPHCGFAFADLHRSMLAALDPSREKRADWVAQLASHAAGGGQLAQRVLDCAQGFIAFEDANYEQAVSFLQPALADSMLFGGSNPQRRIVEETWVEACIRAGKGDKATSVVRDRGREASVRDRRDLERIRGNV